MDLPHRNICRRSAQGRAGQEQSGIGEGIGRKKRLVAAKGKEKKTAKPIAKFRTKKEKLKPKMTLEELKAFRVELMAKAFAANKAK